MRGHFIAADGWYQFQGILDKNIALEMCFLVCGKSFHSHSSLNSPDCPDCPSKTKLTHPPALPADVYCQDHHPSRASSNLRVLNCSWENSLWITSSYKGKFLGSRTKGYQQLEWMILENFSNQTYSMIL